MNRKRVVLGGEPLDWRQVVAVARDHAELSLTRQAWEKITAARKAVEDIAATSTPCYGINTGLGALCHVALDRKQLSRLSFHTLMSHSCGVGESLRVEQVRAIMCCAIVNYSHGFSGLDPDAVKRLIDLLNAGVTPIVPSRGSVGYLTHMAHIGLALLGQGEVDDRGTRMPARDALYRRGWSPWTPGVKDGLSLVNGTPAMTGLACLDLAYTTRLAAWADVMAAMSFEVLGGQVEAFSPEALHLKQSKGVRTVGDNLNRLIAGSPHLARSQGQHLQDALSLRAIPQVHGACRDQLDHAIRVVNGELNAATDNPLVLTSQDGRRARVVSQANPHGEAIAMACDGLAIAICEWSALSERRVYRLVTPEAGRLPAFLTPESGVKSGMMIAQYAASSLVADNKRLAQPAITDNFRTSGLQEDHLSFGESAALKLDLALENALSVLAIEYVAVAQAYDLVKATGFAALTSQVWKQLRKTVAFYREDHPLSQDIQAAFARLNAPEALDDLLFAVPGLSP